MDKIRTDCGHYVSAGDEAYNYYDMKPGVVDPTGPDDTGWFLFFHLDGTYTLLNGQRICTREFARLRGFRDA